MAASSIYVEELNPFIPKNAHEFYEEIGRIITSWGAVDNNLNITLQRINQPSRSSELYDDKTGNNRSRFRALKRWLKNDPELSHVRDEAILVMDYCEKIRPYREAIAHGYFLKFVDASPPTMLFNANVTKGKGKAKSYSFSLNHLRHLSHDLRKLQRVSRELLGCCIGDASISGPELYRKLREQSPANLHQLHIAGRQRNKQP